MLARRFNKFVIFLLGLNLFACFAIFVYITSSEVDIEQQYNFDEIILDKRSAPQQEDIVRSVEEELPSLPFEFIYRNLDKTLRKNETCARYVDWLNIEFHNQYWQKFTNRIRTFHLYGAYYDRRTTVKEVPLVRVLVMTDTIKYEFPRTYCQLWFDERTEPVIVEVSDFNMIWFAEWSDSSVKFIPHMLSCVLPAEVRSLIPRTVSLVGKECDQATNNLKVVYENLPPDKVKQGFAVCVKNLVTPHEDRSVRLIEWLELMRLLGASKVYIYTLQLHANVTRVLEYYQRKGFVEMKPVSHDRGQPSFAGIQHMVMKSDPFTTILNEVVPYNDCLYRHMYKHQYLAVIDVDEVIMPLGHLNNWHELIDYAVENVRQGDCKNFVSYCFSNVYYPKYEENSGYMVLPYSSQAPQYLYMLQHVKRVAEHLERGMATKCLHNTDYAVALHNHFPITWTDSCYAESINESVAQLQHYREPDIPATLNNPVVDANIWRFAEPLINRSIAVLKELGFYAKAKKAPKPRGPFFSKYLALNG